MTVPTRLYMAINTSFSNVVDDEEHLAGDAREWTSDRNPEGWNEYCLERWGEVKPFFFPSTKRVFRSRSAAQSRVDMIRRWGGTGEVIECTPQWQTVEHANRERQKRAIHSRISKLEDAIAAEREKYAEASK